MIGLLEFLSILIGQSISGLLDNLLPDGHHINIDADTDVGALFNWFYVGILSNENKTINNKREVLLIDYLGNGVFSYRYK